MSIWNAILFGVLQGFTEIFPVSSSAHLAIFGNLFGLNTYDFNYNLFCVFIHLGTIISVLISFCGEFSKMFRDFGTVLGLIGPKKEKYPGARLLVMMLVASFPLFLIIPLNKSISRLFTSTIFIGVMLILNGTMLSIADRLNKGEKDWRNMTLSDAFIIGLCQTVSAIPGISRTGTVITAGMATGQKRSFAIRFSFILSIPAALGSNILRMVESGNSGFSWADMPAYLVGLASALLAGLAALQIMKNISEKNNFHFFSYYSWVAGVMFIILTMIF